MSDAFFQFRHPRECGDPLVFKGLKIKMDSRVRGNDEQVVNVIGRGDSSE